MWGVGTFVGPAAGGLFAQWGLWRWAFGMLAAITVGIAAMVPYVLTRAQKPNAAGAGNQVIGDDGSGRAAGGSRRQLGITGV
ncbi:drug efflux membrane protein [Mycobacteroides abscessus subsp. abscessus]|nr:drug efflux membrane protein [Mycobacteroides abscessus subsp. abscessus]